MHPVHRLVIALLGLWVCLTPLLVGAAPSLEIMMKTADALITESELMESRNLRKAVQERAAELYAQVAREGAGPNGAAALLKAGNLYTDLGGDTFLARALECATLATFRPDSPRLAPDALMLKVRIYRLQKEWGRAVRSGLACAETYPKSEAAPRALFEAAQVFETAIRNPSEAERCYSQVVSTYPASPVADDSLMARAGLRAKARQYQQAIADYLAVADSYPAGDLADQALYEAIDLYEGELKDYVKAYELSVRFRKQFPHSALLKKVEKIESKTLKYAKDTPG